MNEALKELRISRGLTQEQMAKMLGYRSKSGYCMIERGKNKTSLEIALKISEILEVPVEELFRGLDVHNSRTKEGNSA